MISPSQRLSFSSVALLAPTDGGRFHSGLARLQKTRPVTKLFRAIFPVSLFLSGAFWGVVSLYDLVSAHHASVISARQEFTRNQVMEMERRKKLAFPRGRFIGDMEVEVVQASK